MDTNNSKDSSTFPVHPFLNFKVQSYDYCNDIKCIIVIVVHGPGPTQGGRLYPDCMGTKYIISLDERHPGYIAYHVVDC